MSYCDIAPGHPFHGPYHDHEYGFPLESDADLFMRLCLEIQQAGLSWLTVLKKKEAFRAAFEGFVPEKVARYGDREVGRLLGNPAIIRNRRKIEATLENARRILGLRKEHGTFKGFLDAHHPLDRPDWVKLFKKTFVFTGGEITGEFLMSTGYLPGAHVESCPVYRRVLRARPAWTRPGR